MIDEEVMVVIGGGDARTTCLRAPGEACLHRVQALLGSLRPGTRLSIRLYGSASSFAERWDYEVPRGRRAA